MRLSLARRGVRRGPVRHKPDGGLIEAYVSPASSPRSRAVMQTGGRLFVVTTELNASRGYVWNMGALAQAGLHDLFLQRAARLRRPAGLVFSGGTAVPLLRRDRSRGAYRWRSRDAVPRRPQLRLHLSHGRVRRRAAPAAGQQHAYAGAADGAGFGPGHRPKRAHRPSARQLPRPGRCDPALCAQDRHRPLGRRHRPGCRDRLGPRRRGFRPPT